MSYIYHHASVSRVIDGDTVEITIDMGNRITWRENFRLRDIDTPERGQPGFAEATEYVKSLFLRHPISRVETFKPDKYGRWLIDIYISVNGGELLVNKLIELDGYGKPYFGGSKG